MPTRISRDESRTDNIQRWFYLEDANATCIVELHVVRAPDSACCVVHTYTKSESGSTIEGPLLGYAHTGMASAALDAYDAWILSGHDDEVLWTRAQDELNKLVASCAQISAVASAIAPLVTT